MTEPPSERDQAGLREQIGDRRRRRREQERQRRIRARRRNLAVAVGCAAGVVVLTTVDFGSDPEIDPAASLGPGQIQEGAQTGPTEPSEETPTVTGFEDPVPILMYHVIAEAPIDAALPDLFVPPDELAEQLDWLDENGFNAVTQADLDAAWNDAAPIAENPIVLSFDDGTREHHDRAMPLLAEHGWGGVLNLKVESLDQGELTEPMVSEMLDSGWELASHSLTHPDLTTLDDAALRREVSGAKRKLEKRFDVKVLFFCYPAGAYDERVIAAVEDAGYTGATTTEPGLAGPERPFTLARIRIEPGDGAAGLETKLATAAVDAG